MTSLPALVDQNGHPVPLDRQLGNPGGEGTVFALSRDSSLAAKVYHSDKRTPELFEKLRAVIGLANPKLLAVAAWPNGLLFDARTRQPVGFTMPRLNDYHQLQQLYNPVQRLKCFPRAGWSFQVRAALNLAAAFDEVHQVGCLMGDVNERNELVSAQALVRLIDCDSFQVRVRGKQFLCEVAVPHYIPPELQGKPLRGLVRTENHDRFGLAVLIYQLLFVGRHPYAGVYRGAGDPPFTQLIAEYRFAQGPMAHTWGMAPAPHTPTLADIPPGLGTLFRRAFERGSEAGTRPQPAEWVAALGQLVREIADCPADPGHKFWRGANQCVWCRLAQRGGPEYYFGVAGGVGTFAVDEATLQAVLRRLAAAEPVEMRYERGRFAPAREPEPEPLPADIDQHRSTAIVLCVTAGLCALLIPLGLVRGFLCAIGFSGALVFGIWLAVLLSRSPWRRERNRRRRARDLAFDDLDGLEAEWERAVRHYRRTHSDLSETVRRLVGECRGLATQYQKELDQVTASAERAARRRHLSLHLIADADIPQIGTKRKLALAINHVYTAADLDEQTILDIEGFGSVLTKALMDWRSDVLRHFRFDPKAAVSPAEQRSLAVRFRARQQQILAETDQKLVKLESLASACRVEIQKRIPELRTAVSAYKQASADMALLMGERARF